MVKIYRLTFSRLMPYIGVRCKFQPTCSNYFIDSVKAHGAMKGTALGVYRVCRCHPFSKGGYDPIIEVGSQLSKEN